MIQLAPTGLPSSGVKGNTEKIEYAKIDCQVSKAVKDIIENSLLEEGFTYNLSHVCYLFRISNFKNVF